MNRQINSKIALSIILLLSVIASFYVVSRATGVFTNIEIKKYTADFVKGDGKIVFEYPLFDGLAWTEPAVKSTFDFTEFISSRVTVL